MKLWEIPKLNDEELAEGLIREVRFLEEVGASGKRCHVFVACLTAEMVLRLKGQEEIGGFRVHG